MSFNKKQIPNYLTIFRIILVPIIIVFLLLPFSMFPEAYHLVNSINVDSKTPVYIGDQFNYESWNLFSWNWIIAGILFCLASITDFIDGNLARKYNWVSNFGKLWDPIADKVLVNSVLICFAYLQVIPVWIVIIMIARDIIVDAARMQAASKNIIVPANIYGKLKTVVQMFGIIFIFFFFNQSLANNSDNLIWYYFVQNLAMLFATLFSVLSGIIYLVKMNKMMKKAIIENA